MIEGVGEGVAVGVGDAPEDGVTVGLIDGVAEGAGTVGGAVVTGINVGAMIIGGVIVGGGARKTHWNPLIPLARVHAMTLQKPPARRSGPHCRTARPSRMKQRPVQPNT